MQVVTCHSGQLQILSQADFARPTIGAFQTRLPALDALLPHGFARGAVHELLGRSGSPFFLAALLARSATDTAAKPFIAWLDPDNCLYPIALPTLGIDLSRVIVLKPTSPADTVWAAAECLRCKGMGAVVAPLARLSRIQARRLQLAAEDGGSAGIFLRPSSAASADYAAATRWLVTPARGERTLQRWNLQLIHGHGGQVQKSVTLEACRETNTLRASPPLADHRREAPREAQATALRRA
jgi:hypothetical protein